MNLVYMFLKQNIGYGYIGMQHVASCIWDNAPNINTIKATVLPFD